jgi:hypothetical protein
LGEDRLLPVKNWPVTTDTARVEDPETRTPQVGPVSADSHWWVACADPFGRSRAMNVLVQHGQVVVVAPPGESAVLDPRQTRQLGRLLASAAASTQT